MTDKQLKWLIAITLTIVIAVFVGYCYVMYQVIVYQKPVINY